MRRTTLDIFCYTAALVLFAALVVLTTFVSGAQATNVVNISCTQDFDNAVNGDSGAAATAFVLQAGCVHTASATATLKDGDQLFCETPPTFTELQVRERAGDPHAGDSAYDPTAYCTVRGSSSVGVVMARQGTTYVEGINLEGGNFTGSADSGKGLKDGQASDASGVYGVVIRNNDAQGVGSCHGVYDRIELTNNTMDPSALGYTGAGIKCVDEASIENSYVHNTQGNGIWCDEGCKDRSIGTFHVNFNVVENNGKDGIRWEFDEPTVSNPGEALIEHNEVHGNVRSGVQARDASDALIRDNIFGGNGSNLAVKASDSGRSDRYDLSNIDIVTNVLNGDVIKGCELPDSVVFCSNNN